jgi:hypothetical protein
MTTQIPPRERPEVSAAEQHDSAAPEVLFEEARRRRRRRWMAGSVLAAGALAAVLLGLADHGGGAGGRSHSRSNGERSANGAVARSKLLATASAGCAAAGVAGSGFVAYACMSGGARSGHSHPAELLVVHSDGSYKGYPDHFSQAELMTRSARTGVLAAHNDAIVQVTATGLRTLLSATRIARLAPGAGAIAAIDSLRVSRAGDILVRVNYHASARHGCENVSAELTARHRLVVLSRSRSGLVCG